MILRSFHILYPRLRNFWDSIFEMFNSTVPPNKGLFVTFYVLETNSVKTGLIPFIATICRAHVPGTGFISWITAFNLRRDSVWRVIVPFYSWGDRGSEKLRTFPTSSSGKLQCQPATWLWSMMENTLLDQCWLTSRGGLAGTGVRHSQWVQHIRGANTTVMKRKNILMQCLKKSKFLQKVHNEQDVKV